MAYGNFYSGPSLVTVGWTNLFRSGNRLECYVSLQTLPFGHHPHPHPRQPTDGQTDWANEPSSKAHFSTLKYFTSKLVPELFSNTPGNIPERDRQLGPSKSRACSALQSCSKHLKHSFQTTHRRQEVGI